MVSAGDVCHRISGNRISNTAIACRMKKQDPMILLKFLPEHTNPSPVNPVLHSHMYDPSVSEQVALEWHPLPVLHSSMSKRKIQKYQSTL